MNQFFDDEDDGKDLEMETKPATAVENSESNSLSSSGDGDVDGAMQSLGGSLPPELMVYTITSEEIEIIVKHFFRGILDNDFFFFLYGETQVSWIRGDGVRNRRIKYARSVIGDEAVDQAIEEAQAEFKERVDPRLWDIYENGSDEQWREVWAESWRNIREWDCAGDLKQMDELESKYPSDLIVLVLYHWGPGRPRTVLAFSTADSELVPLLEASTRFEVLTTKSQIRGVTANAEFRHRGFIRARRQGGDWLFDFPGSTPGTLAHGFLESVRNQIKKALSEAVDEQEDDDLAFEI